MTKKDEATSCCKMESVVTVDSRGQIVLPKDVRKRAGIQKGDKLILISCEEEGKVCCLTMMKVEDSEDMIKEMMGPMLKGVFNRE